MKQLITTIAALVLVGCGPSMSIHDAATNGNIEVVKQHLASGTDVDVKDEEGATPLHYAATKEITELLIANGADVNAKDKYGRTPLHYAVDREIAELLIANGANVNAKDGDGETPLDLTNTEIADLLREHGGKHGVINGAAADGDIEAVKKFLAVGTDVNTKDGWEWTPLHYAAIRGHKEIAELLIAKGANVNAKEQDGYTPLHLARRGHKEIVELLIAAGADVNAKGDDGRTPLDMADDKETADLLRKHGGKTGEELKAEGK